MVARIKVTYTIEEYKTIKVEDFTLTEEEIETLADQEVEKILPGDQDSYSWKWESEPKAKGSQVSPPTDWYVEMPFGKAATNGHCVMFERSPIVLKTEPYWLDAPGKKINIAGLLNAEFKSFPLHCGYFDKVFSPFQRLKGLEVRGEGPDSMAYLIFEGELIACLMPRRDVLSDIGNRFQFNRRAK
jgi:hypothetical protein